jgi:hypothetical protein
VASGRPDFPEEQWLALCSPTSKLSVRYASVEESAFFNHAAQTAKPSDDMVLAYLVEPDSETQPD